jgi:sigma-E factor negative regulatory protein RseC
VGDRPEARVLAIAAGRERATVSVDPALVCARCAAGRGCGAGLFGQRRRPAVIEAKVAAGITLSPGDRVRLEFLASELVRAAWLAYGLPLAGLLVAVLVATRVAPGNDLAAVAWAALGLLAGAWYGRRSLLDSGCLGRCVPTVSEKLPPQRPRDPGRA